MKHTSDPDPFVAKKAQFLVPKVVSKRTTEAVAQFLLLDMDRTREIIASVEEHERGELMVPLIDLSKKWLDDDDPKNHAKAALLMTEVSPTTLRYRLDDLLQSENRDVRVAAMLWPTENGSSSGASSYSAYMASEMYWSYDGQEDGEAGEDMTANAIDGLRFEVSVFAVYDFE